MPASQSQSKSKSKTAAATTTTTTTTPLAARTAEGTYKFDNFLVTPGYTTQATPTATSNMPSTGARKWLHHRR